MISCHYCSNYSHCRFTDAELEAFSGFSRTPESWNTVRNVRYTLLLCLKKNDPGLVLDGWCKEIGAAEYDWQLLKHLHYKSGCYKKPRFRASGVLLIVNFLFRVLWNALPFELYPSINVRRWFDGTFRAFLSEGRSFYVGLTDFTTARWHQRKLFNLLYVFLNIQRASICQSAKLLQRYLTPADNRWLWDRKSVV